MLDSVVTHEHRPKLKPIDGPAFSEMLTYSDCVFCTPPKGKVFLETDHFYVTYDCSPLTEGHLLIHTKDHIGCSGEVDPDLFGELAHIKNSVGRMLEELYGAVAYYEHGRAGHCNMIVEDKICHHFHLHALPMDVDVSEVISSRFKNIASTGFDQMPELYERYGAYLFFENCKGNMYFYPVKEDLEPHYFRTVISNALGTPEKADYKEYSNRNEVNNLIKKMRAHLYES